MNLEIIKIASKSKNNNLLEDFTDKFKKKILFVEMKLKFHLKLKIKKF